MRFSRWVNVQAKPQVEFKAAAEIIRVMGVPMKCNPEKIYAAPHELYDMEFLGRSGIHIWEAEKAFEAAPADVDFSKPAHSEAPMGHSHHTPWLTTLADGGFYLRFFVKEICFNRTLG